MANDLYEAFLEAAGKQGSNAGDVQFALQEVIAEWQRDQQNAVQQPVKTIASKSGDSTLTTVLKSGFGVAPLIGGLISLFGGGGEPEPPALVKYAMPSSIQFDAAVRQGQITTADYDQTGRPRTYSEGGSNDGSQAGASPGAQITVNVQAMDARSFLDRSGDIAMAVRDAMLNLNSINDVVNDL